jgi:hypothetical protein
MANEETVEIYKRMAQLMEALNTVMNAAEASSAALSSRADATEAATTELMKNSLAAFDSINTQASHVATLLVHMTTMQRDIALIKESLVALASTRH